MKWTSYYRIYPARWNFKKDIPKHLRHLGKRVEFRFCIAWIVRDENKRVLMGDGTWMDTMDFHLTTPGHVIGMTDMASADAEKWAVEWRNAMADRRLNKNECI
jgi:hypothetical protein